ALAGWTETVASTFEVHTFVFWGSRQVGEGSLPHPWCRIIYQDARSAASPCHRSWTPSRCALGDIGKIICGRIGYGASPPERGTHGSDLGYRQRQGTQGRR